MAIINEESKVHPLLRNGHIHSIWTYYTRKKIPVPYQRERINTNDDDFIDLDFIKKNNRDLIILLHGLDGNTQAHYVRGFADYALENNYDICAKNFRGCSGTLNNKYSSYHSGKTDDLHFVIEHIIEKHDYDNIFIVGFSLGGNVIFKYLGENKFNISEKIKATGGISVPVDLKSGCEKLSRGIYLGYSLFLLRHLIPKTRQKMIRHKRPKDEIKRIRRVTNFRQFDDLYTAPAHGFEDALDYWDKNSSKQFLNNIQVPSLLISSLDDPFLSKECFPFEIAEQHEYFHMLSPKNGGHVGFANRLATPKHLWSDVKLIEFFNQYRSR